MSFLKEKKNLSRLKNSKKYLEMKKYCLLALLITTIFNFAFAKNGKIEGFVLDTFGNPIPDVHVEIPKLNLGDNSDSEGHFNLTKVPNGKHKVTFSHISFETKTLRNLKVQGGKNLGKITLEPKIFELEEFVVTATRNKKRTVDVSVPLNIVEQEVIQKRNAKTSAEALREETGVFVQKTNHGGGSAILRGLSSNQILLLVDGIKLNNSTYRLGNHQYLTTVDNNSIQRIEVVRGPTSVLYGSDALGGTINLLTQKPSLLTKDSEFQFSGKVNGRFASADQEKTTRGQFSIFNNKFAFQSGFSYKNYGDLKRGSFSGDSKLETSTNGKKQSPTGFDAIDFDGKLIYQFTESQSIVLAHQTSRQFDVPRYDKYESGSNVLWIYKPQNRYLTYLNYENSLQSKFVKFLKASVSYQIQEEGRETQKTVTSEIEKEKDQTKTLGFTLQLNSNYENNFFTYGFDFYKDKVQSEAKNYSAENVFLSQAERGRFPDGSDYKSLGVYLQDEIRFTEKFTTILGTRYSFFDTKFTIPFDSSATLNLGTVEQDFQSLTGSVGFNFQTAKNIFLNANVGQAFRAPNLSDLTKLGESKGNTYEVPNTELEPEKMLSFDAGFKTNFSKFRSDFSVFYAKVTDLIGSADATFNGSPTIDDSIKVKSKQNIGNAYLTGVESSFKYFFEGKTNLYGNLTYTYGQNTTLDEPVGGVPPMFGLLGFNWENENFSVDSFARFATKQDRLSEDDKDDTRIPEGGTPSWYTLNLRLGKKFGEHFYGQFSVENIFDYNYREHGSGVNGSGRNFILSFEAKI